MKRIIFSISLLLFVTGMYGQARRITLEECQQKTQDNYPLVRQYDLILCDDGGAEGRAVEDEFKRGEVGGAHACEGGHQGEE